MTEKVFIERVIDIIDYGITTSEDAQAIREAAVERLEKLEKAAERKRERANEKAAENEPFFAAICNEILGDEPITATMIGERLGVSTQKASALMRHLVEEGRAAKCDVKIPKKGTQKGYTRV